MSVFHKLCVALVLSPIGRWAARKVVCKLNDCILGRSQVQCEATRSAPVAKRVRRLTLLNCSLATCFAAGVHSKLQLLEVRFIFLK